MILTNWIQGLFSKHRIRPRSIRRRPSPMARSIECLEAIIVPSITISADAPGSGNIYTITEGDSITFTITSDDPGSTTTVSWYTDNNQRGLDGTDYERGWYDEIPGLGTGYLTLPTFDDDLIEGTSSFEVHFSTDGFANPANRTGVTVYVLDNDISPPEITTTGPLISIYTWNQPPSGVAFSMTTSQMLGHVTATDPDGITDTLTFSGGNSLFTVYPNGDVVAATSVDFLNSPTQHYYVTVTVTDSWGLTDTKQIEVIWINDQFTDGDVQEGFAEIDVSVVDTEGVASTVDDFDDAVEPTIDFGEISLNVQQSATLRIRNQGFSIVSSDPPAGMTDALVLGKWTIPDGLYVAPQNPTSWYDTWQYALDEDSTLERLVIPDGATASGGTGLDNNNSTSQLFDLILLPQDAGLYEGTVYFENNDNWIWNTTFGPPVREGTLVANESDGTWTTYPDEPTGPGYWGQLHYTSSGYELSYGSQSDSAGLPDSSSTPGNPGDTLDEGIFGIHVRAMVQGPEIAVALQGAGGSLTDLRDGISTVSMGTATPSTPVTRTLVITNKGTEDLVLQPVSLSGPFTVTTNFTVGQIVEPGDSTTLTIQYAGADGGDESGSISFANNDFNENTFDLDLEGVFQAPEISLSVENLLGNPAAVASGATVDFGSVAPGETASEVFQITNSGLADLNLGQLQLPTGFSLGSSYSGSLVLSPGQSTTVTIDFLAVNGGIFSGQLQLASNDGNENPYLVTLTTTVDAPEIKVTWDDTGVLIADGATASLGTVAAGSPLSRTLRVFNIGEQDLTVQAVSTSGAFQITSNFTANQVIHVGQSATFTVTFQSADGGSYASGLSFVNTDDNENPFNLQLTAISDGPEIAIGLKQPDGSFADLTSGYSGVDFGMVLSGVAATKTVRISNLGTQVLDLGTLTLPAGFEFSADLEGTSLDPGEHIDVDVQVSATARGSYDGSVSISNTDANEDPFEFNVAAIVRDPELTVTQSLLSLAEDASTASARVVGDITVVDDGFGVFQLSLSGADAGMFEIVTTSGVTQLRLKSGITLDHETNGVLDVRVKADDPAFGPTPDDYQDLSVTITDVNEAPVINNQTLTVGEDQTIVGNVIASDQDVGQTLTYSLIDDPDDLFTINSSTGQLALASGKTLDFETSTSHTVTISVVDNDSSALSDTAVVTIQVTDVNEAPTLTVTQTVEEIEDGTNTAAARIAVATLQINDDALGHANDLLTLTGLDSSLFEIGTLSAGLTATLYLKQNASLDHASNPVLTVTVNLNDATVGATPDDQETLTINVPQSFPEINLTVDDASGGPETIASGSTLDLGAVTLGTTVSRVFEISNSGLADLHLGTLQLPAGFTLGSAYSGSIVVAPGQSATITVDFIAANGGTFSGQLELANDDADENPYLITLAATVEAPEIKVTWSDTGTELQDGGTTSLGTTATGTALARTLRVYNIGLEDLTVQPVSITGAFQITADLTSNQVIHAGEFATFTVSFESADGGSFESSLSFVNTDNNENPFNITLSAISEGPEIAVGLKQPNGSFADLTSGSSGVDFGMVLSGVAATKTVRISNLGTQVLDLGTLTLPAGFEFSADLEGTSVEPGAHIDVDIRVSATARGTYDGSVSISNTDANEDPFEFDVAAIVRDPELTVTQSLSSLPEDSSTASSRVVGDITVVDDGLGVFQLSLSGSDSSLFEIVTTSGVTQLRLKAGITLDHETNGVLDVRVNADDPAFGPTPDDYQDLAVTITDVNEEPVISAQTFAISETQTNIGNVIATDPDVGQALTYSLIEDPDDLFTINTSTGHLSLASGKALDFETSASHTVTVLVVDNGSPELSHQAVISIEVTDVNEAPTLTVTQTVLDVPEDTDTTADKIAVAKLQINDDALGHAGDLLTLSGTDASLFEIGPLSSGLTATLYLKQNVHLDYETNPVLNITVTLNDSTVGSNPDDQEDLTINISNVIEPPKISVALAGTNVPDGSMTPVDFGDVPLGSPVTRTFTITNSGDADLTIGSMTVPTGFIAGSLTPASPLAAGQTATFTLTLVATTVGTFPGTVSFATNSGVSTENPFDFSVTGTVRTTAELTVEYLGGGNFEDSGILDLGSTIAGQDITKQIVLRNTGTADLSVTLPLAAPGFIIELEGNPTGTSLVIPPEGSQLVTIRFDPSTAVHYASTFTLETDDFDESSFSLTLFAQSQPDTTVIDSPPLGSIPGWSSASIDSGNSSNPRTVLEHGANFGQTFGASFADWAFTNVSPGMYRVLGTWPTQLERRSLGESGFVVGPAMYGIYSGAPNDTSPTLLSTFVANQNEDASDSQLDGQGWSDMGQFLNQLSGSFFVRLFAPDSSAGTRVYADNVRLERINPESDVLTFPAGRESYTFDVRDNDPQGSIDPRIADSTLGPSEYDEVWTVTDILDPGITQVSDTEWTTPDGVLHLNPDGTLTYYPDDPFAPMSRLDFTYDLQNASHTITTSADTAVSLVFRGNLPTARPDQFEVSHRKSLNFDVTSNDFDPQGDPLAVFFQGVPDGFITADSSLYHIQDSLRFAVELTDEAVWNLKLNFGSGFQTIAMAAGLNGDGVVNAINAANVLPSGVTVVAWDAPQIGPDGPGTKKVIAVKFVNSTASPVEVVAQSTNAAAVIHQERGAITKTTDGQFTYTPDPVFFMAHGPYTEQIRYGLRAGLDQFSAEPGLVQLRVTNAAPFGFDREKTVVPPNSSETSHTAYAISYDTYDPDGDPLAIKLLSLPSAGEAPGTWRFDNYATTGFGLFTPVHPSSSNTLKSHVYTMTAFDGHTYSPIFSSQITVYPSDYNSGWEVLAPVPPRYLPDNPDFPENGWSVSGHSLEDWSETGVTTSLGDVEVDLLTGSVRTSQGLDVDARETTSSDGQYSLVYNSPGAVSNPVVQATVTRQGTDQTGTTISAQLTWLRIVVDSAGHSTIDELLDHGGYGATLAQFTTELTDTVITLAADRNDLGQTLVEAHGNGVYRWRLDITINGTKTTSLSGDALLVAPQVTDRAVDPASEANYSTTSPFNGWGQGWSLGGLPSLWIDTNGRVSDFFNPAPILDDTAILFDSQGGSRLFVTDQQYSQPWIAVRPGTRTTLPNEFGKLTFDNTNHEYTYVAADQTQYIFEQPYGAQGSYFARLISITPVIGPATTFDYDQTTGQLQAIHSADGTTTTFVYTGSGDLDRIEMPQGRTLEVTVSAGGLESLSIDNLQRSFTYNASGSMDTATSGTSGDAIKTTVQYSTAGLVSSVSLGDVPGSTPITLGIVPVAEFRRDNTSLPVTYAQGSIPVAQVIRKSNTVKRYLPATNTDQSLDYDIGTYYSFDERGRFIQTDAYTLTTSASPPVLQDSDGHLSESKLEWDTFDNVISSTEVGITPPDGQGSGYQFENRITSYRYDYLDNGPDYDTPEFRNGFDNLASPQVFATFTKQAFGNVTQVFQNRVIARYEYDPVHGLMTSSTDVAGSRTRYFRDARGLTLFIDGPAGTDEYFEYGSLDGNDDVLLSHTDTLGMESTVTAYDTNRRPLTVEEVAPGETRTTDYIYVVPGMVTAVSRVNSAQLSRSEIVYDQLDRVVGSVLKGPADNILGQSSQTYYSNGLPDTSTDGLGVETKLIFNRLGNLTTEIVGLGTPLAEATSYDYIDDGSLSQTTYPDFHTEKSYYDPKARTTWVVTDRVWQVQNGTSSFGTMVVESQTDAFGNLISTDNLLTGLKTTFTYDVYDQMTSQTQHSVWLDFATTGHQQTDLTATWTYDALGNVLQQRLPGLAATVADYDALSRITRTEVVAKGGGVFSFVYDAAGNQLQSIESRLTPSRNSANQLVYQRSRYVSSQTFDQWGRLKTQQDAGSDGALATWDYSFDATLGLEDVKTVDRNGTTTYQYLDSAGQVRRVVDAGGAVTSMEYDLAGHLTLTSLDDDPSPALHLIRKTRQNYDALGRPSGTEFFVSPNSSTDLTTIFQSIAVEYPANAASSAGRKVIQTAANGAQTVTEYDSIGNIIRVQQPDPGLLADGEPNHAAAVTTWDYDYLKLPDGKAAGAVQVSQVGPPVEQPADSSLLSRRTRSVVNSLGWVLRSLNPIQVNPAIPAAEGVLQADYVYDTAGRVYEQFDKDNNRVRTTYDAATGQPSEMLRFLASTGSPGVVPTKMEYDSAGNQTRLTDPDNNQTRWTFDGLNRMLSETIDISEIVGGILTTVAKSRTWNPVQLATTYTDRNGQSIVTETDPANRQVTVKWYETLPVGGDPGVLDETFISLFNAAGQLTSSKEYSSTSSLLQTLAIKYNGLGQAVDQTLDYVFGTASGTYTAPTQRIATGYNSLGLRGSSQVFLDFTPDSDSSNDVPISFTVYDRDELGRVQGIVQTFEHDAASAALWSGTDVSNSSLGSVSADRSIKIAYQADGSRKDLVRLDYDRYDNKTGSPGSLVDHVVGFSSYAYGTDGRLFQLTHSAEQGSGKAFANYTTSYNLSNGRTSGTTNQFFNGVVGATAIRSEQRTYTNDTQGRLLTSTLVSQISPLLSVTPNENYEYDANGNRLKDSSSSGSPEVNIIRMGDRLAQDDEYRYTYDPEGHLIQRDLIASAPGEVEREQYDWNRGGQLVEVRRTTETNGPIETVRYRYDLLGRLAATETLEFPTVTSSPVRTVTATVWDDGDPILRIQLDSNGLSAEQAQTGKIVQSYLNGPNGNEVLAADVVPASLAPQVRQTVWMYADTVGSVRSYVIDNGDSTPPAVQHRQFDSYGNRYVSILGDEFFDNNSTNSYLNLAPTVYDGYLRDETSQLYYQDGRWYDPKSGRYLNDAGGENGYAFRADQQSLNNQSGTSANSNPNWSSMEGAGPFSGLVGNTVGRAVYAAAGDNLANVSDAALFGGVFVASVGITAGGLAVLPASALGYFTTGLATTVGAWGAASGFAHGVFSTAASSEGASFADYVANGGIGALFGAANPLDAFASLGGGLIGAAPGLLYGNYRNAGVGYQIGSTVGGIFGSGWDDIARNGAPLYHALGRSGVTLGVAGGVGYGAYLSTGSVESAITWGSLATLPGSLLARLVPCFPAGTPILTPDGSKPIEQLRAGDLVLSRDEHDVNGPVAAKVIEETFVRQGEILELSIGGQIIQITPEHPVYVADKGWTPAGEVQPGDLLSILSFPRNIEAGNQAAVELTAHETGFDASHDVQTSTATLESGEWLEVESIESTGRFDTVYNFRVADWHTYFVGDSSWGFSAWAHNSCNNHHSIPKVIGGFKKQFMYTVDRSAEHVPFHIDFAANLKATGFPLNPLGGPGNSADAFRAYFFANKGSQRYAFDVLIRTAREFDAANGTQFLQFVKHNIRRFNFDMINW